MYASWVRRENPRTAMSRIIRARSSLMSHLRREVRTEVIVSARLSDVGSGVTGGRLPVNDRADQELSFDLPRQRFSSTTIRSVTIQTSVAAPALHRGDV